ncbi:MAG: 2-oxoacid:acceptor oxidoreductase family protein [Defluviitaleaceae bacterium]|nr:2-oxoacid:acceptor oxidoreductase family protein [Defluviitaleaceae bacterium]
MTTRMVFSGFGGQGVLTLGQIIATIAMNQGKEVTWMPSYGPEMRGGTANCAVIVSDGPIGSPQVLVDIDVLCALNKPSIDKFLPKVRPGGMVLYNSSLITDALPRSDVDSVAVDATNIASAMGNLRVQNMVMIAGFLKATDLFSINEVKATLQDKFASNPSLLDINLAAIQQGM